MIAARLAAPRRAALLTGLVLGAAALRSLLLPVGDAFSTATLPKWAAPGAGLWAPDIRYVNGQYRMYYVVTETTVITTVTPKACHHRPVEDRIDV